MVLEELEDQKKLMEVPISVTLWNNGLSVGLELGYVYKCLITLLNVTIIIIIK